jgi:polyhydroxyalkanoate synthase
MSKAGKKNDDAVSSDDLSRQFLASLAKLTGGLSPHAFGGAWLNVLSNLAVSPGRQIRLARNALEKSMALAQFAGKALTGDGVAPKVDNPAYSRRFSDPAWSRFPFNVIAQTFVTASEWASESVKDVPGAAAAAENVVSFTVREGLELVAPDNYLLTNPELIDLTRREYGRNLLRGAKHFAEDVQRTLGEYAPHGTEDFEVGVDIGASPGQVILRNRLMELIQYTPQTKKVFAEPILICPAWIMKYYILDLSARNSLVKYLTDLGFTVFMISWKNPTAEDRDLTMDDYLTLGVKAALDAVEAVAPRRKIHAVGYCIGGTLLSIAAAELAAQDDKRLATMTSFAAQVDFSEPGELSVFISPAQLAMLEAMMWKEGVLESSQMGGAFVMLRTHDLLWGPKIGDYVKGERSGLNDLMAWNADGTRMAYRMHTDYLHQLYLNNDLAEDRYIANGTQISLSDITLPMFVVGTETDHVAPWRSVYKIGRLTRSGDYTFCLTSGGHNAGIISGPQHPRRRHRVHTTRSGERLLSPAKYLETVDPSPGSWWPTWAEWLKSHSSKTLVNKRKMGAPAKGYKPLGPAPGEYVLRK